MKEQQADTVEGIMRMLICYVEILK